MHNRSSWIIPLKNGPTAFIHSDNGLESFLVLRCLFIALKPFVAHATSLWAVELLVVVRRLPLFSVNGAIYPDPRPTLVLP